MLLDERVDHMRKAFTAFCKLYLLVLSFIGKHNFQKLILQNRDLAIQLVDHLPADVLSQNMLCRFLGISPHQYKVWRTNSSYRCGSSLAGPVCIGSTATSG